jgi:excisionase family DNA binding protein
MPPETTPEKPGKKPVPTKIPEILDVGTAAAFLTVSRDTVYHLFQTGQLPGRKVGRKWVTTKAAVIRWLEHSSAHDSLARAVQRGDRDALTKAIKDGKVRVK